MIRCPICGANKLFDTCGLFEESQYRLALAKDLYSKGHPLRAKYHLTMSTHLMHSLARRLKYRTTMFHTNNN